MRHWAVPFAIGLAIGVALMLLLWIVPSFLDSAALVEPALQRNFRLPELVGTYTPELVAALKLGFVEAAGAALAGFVTWAAVTRAVRPTGPGQIRGSWRRVLWFVLLAAVAAVSFWLPYRALLFQLDTVDPDVGTEMAAVSAVAASLVFWGLCVVGTERLIRPAVPCGDRFVAAR